MNVVGSGYDFKRTIKYQKLKQKNTGDTKTGIIQLENQKRPKFKPWNVKWAYRGSRPTLDLIIQEKYFKSNINGIQFVWKLEWERYLFYMINEQKALKVENCSLQSSQAFLYACMHPAHARCYRLRRKSYKSVASKSSGQKVLIRAD